MKLQRKVKRIAEERVDILINLAKDVIYSDFQLAQRYVKLAKDICMRYKVKILSEHRRQLCRCNTFLIPGLNCRIRLNSKKRSKIVTCLNCGGIKRYPYYQLGKKR
jgi:RNase P subunit RPR2